MSPQEIEPYYPDPYLGTKERKKKAIGKIQAKAVSVSQRLKSITLLVRPCLVGSPVVHLAGLGFAPPL